MARKCQGFLGFSDRKCSSRETKNYFISCLHKQFIVLNLNVKYSEFICFLKMWISQACSLKCLRRHIKAVAKCAGVPPSRNQISWGNGQEMCKCMKASVQSLGRRGSVWETSQRQADSGCRCLMGTLLLNIRAPGSRGRTVMGVDGKVGPV